MFKQDTRCANGKPGFDTVTARAYTMRRSLVCQNEAMSGHIYCERCRVEAGGSRKGRAHGSV